MSDLYQALCVVRTSVLNIIGQSIVQRAGKNFPDILKSIASELNEHVDVVEGLLGMSEDELLDLGFDYLNDESDLMLIPAWLFPFLPNGTALTAIDGHVYELSDVERPTLHSDSWLAAGLADGNFADDEECDDGECTRFRDMNGWCTKCDAPGF